MRQNNDNANSEIKLVPSFRPVAFKETAAKATPVFPTTTHHSTEASTLPATTRLQYMATSTMPIKLPSALSISSQSFEYRPLQKTFSRDNVNSNEALNHQIEHDRTEPKIENLDLKNIFSSQVLEKPIKKFFYPYNKPYKTKSSVSQTSTEAVTTTLSTPITEQQSQTKANHQLIIPNQNMQFNNHYQSTLTVKPAAFNSYQSPSVSLPPSKILRLYQSYQPIETVNSYGVYQSQQRPASQYQYQLNSFLPQTQGNVNKLNPDYLNQIKAMVKFKF